MGKDKEEGKKQGEWEEKGQWEGKLNGERGSGRVY